MHIIPSFYNLVFSTCFLQPGFCEYPRFTVETNYGYFKTLSIVTSVLQEIYLLLGPRQWSSSPLKQQDKSSVSYVNS